MRRFRWILVLLVSVYLLGSLAAGIFLAEYTLHPPRHPLRHVAGIHDFVRHSLHTEVQDVAITAADGVSLRGWYVQPEDFNGSAVILLHGVTDNRTGMTAFGQLFLQRGYAVLLPDSRAHGESGGPIATYGVLERDDVHRWVSWLYANHPPACVYGLGESMGAAILVQSLAVEPRFCAAIAESPFATFRDGAYSRFAQHSGTSLFFGKSVGRLAIESGLLYARVRYGLDMTRASGMDAVARSAVPLLLVHGAADRNIWPVNSEMLHRAALSRTELWIVPGAPHTGAWQADPLQFESRVLAWCETHRHSATMALGAP